MKKKLTGLIAAPYTPMHSDGTINPDMIDNLAALLRKEGVSGAFICGTTGEGSSLTTRERKLIAERWSSACANDLALIVHVGHNSIEEARTLADHAQSVGAHGIAAMPPSFFKPASIDQLVAVCKPVAAAAPELPFYYYHIPSMTGVNLSMPAFLEAGSKEIPTLTGIKYSTSDLMQFHQCATMDDGQYTMFFGSDEMLLGAMAMGAEGAVGSTYNYAAPNYINMMKAYHDGDMKTARRYANQAVALVETLLKFGVLPAGKAIMKMRGVDCGPLRLPLQPLSIDKQRALHKALEALPLFASVKLTAPEDV